MNYPRNAKQSLTLNNILNNFQQNNLIIPKFIIFIQISIFKNMPKIQQIIAAKF